MVQTVYKNSDQTVFEDAKALFQLNKNILLKGPTGSGKTKLAETLSNVMKLPMHQVNCSVDLDTESLLGFKQFILMKKVTKKLSSLTVL